MLQPPESLQIRKEFDTRIELEPGFANVELLVLPEEPTLSILKDEYEEQMRLARTKNANTYSDIDHDNADVDDEDEIILLDGSQCKRLSTALAAILVFASLAGTIQVVSLMEPDRRWQGWLGLCGGVALLLPCAVLMHKLIKVFTAYQEPSAKQGIVIDGVLTKPENSMLAEACLAPSSCCDDERQLNNVASYMAPESSGCYFIRYNTSKRTTPAYPPGAIATTAAAAAADGTDSSLVSSHDLVSSNSSISSLSDDSPLRGQVLWQSVPGSMDSL
jgi:hypothetical protein